MVSRHENNNKPMKKEEGVDRQSLLRKNGVDLFVLFTW